MKKEEYKKVLENVEDKTKMFFTGGHYRMITINKGFYVQQQ